MPEFSYIELACKKLEVDPDSILAFHEYDNHLAIVTAEGKKFIFSFEELEELKEKAQKKAAGIPASSKNKPAGNKSPIKPKKTLK